MFSLIVCWGMAAGACGGAMTARTRGRFMVSAAGGCCGGRTPRRGRYQVVFSIFTSRRTAAAFVFLSATVATISTAPSWTAFAVWKFGR